jgi:putative redox protein
MHDETPLTASARWLEGYQVVVRAGKHSWVADEPERLGGDGLGANPFEQLLGALASCLTITVAHFAGQAKVPLAGLWAEVEGCWDNSGEKPVYRVTAELKARGDLDERAVKRLERYAERCPIHGLLSRGAEIALRVVRV